jgi:DNA primase
MIDPITLGLETYTVSGDEIQVLCPFHDDHRPSASFNMAKGLFYCYGCGTAMNARKLSIELGSDIKTLKDVSILEKIQDEKEWRQLLYSPLAIDNEYLHSRGVTNDQIKQWQIRYFDERIIFPLFRPAPDICGVQERITGGSSTYRYIVHGEKPPVWPLDDSFYSERRPILVEGVFGALRLRSFGVVAFATIGSQVTNRIIRALNGRTPTVWYDNDYAGYVGSAKLILGSNAVAIVSDTPPDECPDRDFMERVLEGSEKITSLDRLAELSRAPRRFSKHISRWIYKSKSRSR